MPRQPKKKRTGQQESPRTQSLYEAMVSAGLPPVDWKKMGRPTKYSPDMCDKVRECGALGMSKTSTQVELGISDDTWLNWCKEYPDFLGAVQEHEKLCLKWWEEAGKKGFAGLIEGFNAQTYMFNMRNRFRDRYADIKENRISGADGGALQIEQRQILKAEDVNPEVRDMLIEVLEQALAMEDEDAGSGSED